MDEEAFGSVAYGEEGIVVVSARSRGDSCKRVFVACSGGFFGYIRCVDGGKWQGEGEEMTDSNAQ